MLRMTFLNNRLSHTNVFYSYYCIFIMKFIKQKTNIEIQNVDSKIGNKVRIHGELLPFSCRCLIVGGSGSGKTNLMISLLEHPNGLKYENIYVFSKSLFQEKYVNLKKTISKIKGMKFFSYSNSDDVIDPSLALPNSIMIFDDIATAKQGPVRSFFCMGRHRSVESFYISQTYSFIPLQNIRVNANLIVMFRQNLTNLRHVFNDAVSPDMSFEKFCQMCSECWNERYSFVVIDLDSEIDKGKYRRNFNEFIITS